MYAPEDFEKRIFDLDLSLHSFVTFEDAEMERMGEVNNWNKGDSYLTLFSTNL